jgi:uncharacterized protein (DUF3084 family)
MKKEYRVNITPAPDGDRYTVEVLHDGQYVADMRRYFNHLYTGKAPNKKVVKNSKTRAVEYIAELENAGYVKYTR